jgi:hypothetical protein
MPAADGPAACARVTIACGRSAHDGAHRGRSATPWPETSTPVGRVDYGFSTLLCVPLRHIPENPVYQAKP